MGTRGAYYNENDPFAAAWLRALIAEGHIAPGDVDERDVRDVAPAELAGFDQHHFFAGIGVWSHALRWAGWPDDRPIWTGSCPCQPFSAAGKGGGFDDERHLWPSWHWLIEQCRPDIVVGEQVASKDGLAWLDLVSTDMENTGYAIGAVDTCAASVGAPHIRQRLYWVADGSYQQRHRAWDARSEWRPEYSDSSGFSRLAHGNGGNACTERLQRSGEQRFEPQDGDTCRLEHDPRDGRQQGWPEPGERSAVMGCGAGGMWNAPGPTREWRARSLLGAKATLDSEWVAIDGDLPVGPEYAGTSMGERPGTTDGYWRDADWLCCTDGRWRPAESGTFPLVDGLAGRVGRLRGYGNAIVAPLATAFIESVMEIL